MKPLISICIAFVLSGCIPDFDPNSIITFVDNLDDDWDKDGFTESNGDCDDTNNEIYPGVVEYCDGFDNDCNGELDDDPQDIKWYQDEDQDSYGVEEFLYLTVNDLMDMLPK